MPHASLAVRRDALTETAIARVLVALGLSAALVLAALLTGLKEVKSTILWLSSLHASTYWLMPRPRTGV